MSSILGSGCWSTASWWYIVILKSPQILTLPFFFSTGAMGVAHLLVSTQLDIIPVFSNSSNSCFTFGFNAYGICLDLQNTGLGSSLNFKVLNKATCQGTFCQVAKLDRDYDSTKKNYAT
jgi:hypothetical protein